MTRVLVCGGRNYANKANVFAWLDWLDGELPPDRIDVIIHGGARGADALGKEWAAARGRVAIAVPADWRRGLCAGPIRNQLMLDREKPNVVIAFPGNRGTADMVRRAKADKSVDLLIEAGDEPPRQGKPA